MTASNQVFVLRDRDGDDEWRVVFDGGILAATWRSRHAAAAHLARLEAGEARPHYQETTS